MPPDFCIVCATHAGCIPRRGARTGDMDRNLGKTKGSQPFLGVVTLWRKCAVLRGRLRGDFMRERPLAAPGEVGQLQFQFSPPRGQLSYENIPVEVLLFQSTAPVRGATDVQSALGARLVISIHARVGGDDRNLPYANIPVISIHASRAGGDQFCKDPLSLSINFNPRPPCGGRPVRVTAVT